MDTKDEATLKRHTGSFLELITDAYCIDAKDARRRVINVLLEGL